MTLLDIRNQIVGVLCAKDTFTLADFDKVSLREEHEADKASFIRECLAELVDIGLVRKVGDLDTWILSTPLNVQGQQVHVSMETANRVAEEVNAYLDAGDFDGPRVDSLNITEGSILALLQIIEEALD